MMTSHEPVPTTPSHSSVVWLLGAALLPLLPLARDLPIWVCATYLAVIVWRFGHDQWGLPQPGRFVRVVLTLAAIFFVYRHYGTLLGREPGVALLVLLTGFKLFELRSLRDAMLAALLLFLMLLGSFLFDNSLLLGLYTLAAVVGIVAVLVRIQHPGVQPSTTFRMAGVFVAQALPIMLVAYFLFPRLPDALWGLPTSGGGGTTGIPDDMRPGDLNSLSLLDDVAFRAYFDGPLPLPRDLYWRARVFWDSDGQTWKAGPPLGIIERLRAGSSATRYRLVLEPTNKHWLPVLDLPTHVPNGVRARSGFTYETVEPRRDRQTLEFTSVIRYQTGSLDSVEQQRATVVPPASDRVKALAAQWRKNATEDSDVVRAALDHFRREEFFYTLTPPPLGVDPVDEFLFGTRRGFCEHYAAAFVTLMRAAGIPARVVIGYQGGVYNATGNYVIVRQADAHAWAEVWTSSLGWTRVDPTAAIAPSRVELGIDAVRRLSAQGLPLNELGAQALQRAIQLPWIEAAWLRSRLVWDYVNLSWYLWVSDYDLERQSKLLERLGLTSGTVTLFVMVGLQLLLLYALFRWRARQPRDPIQRTYDDYCRRLARIGITRARHEGPLAFSVRVIRQRPDLASSVDRISRMYMTIRYGSTADKSSLAEFVGAVRAFRPSRDG